MPALTLRKAAREKTKIRIGLSGPSGSGKTFSALLLASGMAGWDKIAIIDTENGSADLYAHLGPYSVITLGAPFSPERYIEALHECEKAGMEVIILDSATHEWDGKGGCLESNDLLASAKFKGNTWAAWSVTTPRHQQFIQAIVSSPCHIITTVRSKTDTIQTEDKKVKKVGLREIQREGWEYELTLNFTLDRDGNYAVASKDRTGLFSNADPFKVSKATGATILAWASSGEEPAQPKDSRRDVPNSSMAKDPEEDEAHSKREATVADLEDLQGHATAEQVTEIAALCKELNGTVQAVYSKFGIKGQPTKKQAMDLIDALSKKVQAKAESPVPQS